MKTLLKLSGIASVIILIAMGCKKSMSDEHSTNETIIKEFNAAFVKEWYYGTFIKSDAFLSYNQKEKGKKLPDWKNGVRAVIGKWKVVEYPLVKAKSSFSIPGNNALTPAQSIKISEASLSRIAFIKTDDNQIIAREIDYIPDWEYLKNKQFNMDGIKSINSKSDFSGKIVVKNWDGTIVSTQIMENGNTVKIGKKANAISTDLINSSNNSLEGECTTNVTCEWYRECEIHIYGDLDVTYECGPWIFTGVCIEETYCPDMGNPCQLYGVCDAPPPPPIPSECDPNLVSPEEQNFNAYNIMEMTPFSFNAPTSNISQDPLSGVISWNVAEASMGGWNIKANTQYSYYHNSSSYNSFLFDPIFEIFKYQTVSSHFIGSNTFITSIWTQTSLTDQVVRNNSPNAYGRTTILGTVRHKLNIELKLPYCGPVTLDVTNEIGNTLNFYPR